MVAEPSATEVTRPVESTVATSGLRLTHVTEALALAINKSFWSVTVADSWAVSPSEAKLRLSAERVIDVATGAATTGVSVAAVGASPPQLPKKNSVLNAMVFFMPSFCP